MRHFALVVAVLAFCAGCSTTETRQKIAGSKTGISTQTNWDNELDLVVTGLFGFGEHCIDQNVEITQGSGRLEHDTQVLQADGGTHWEFHTFTDQKIQWHACANNCIFFGCPTLKLHIAYKAVAAANVAAARTTKWGVYSEKTNQGDNLSCWVCNESTFGTAACLGNVLIPDTEWNMREQANASACVLKKRGKCLEIQNYNCPE